MPSNYDLASSAAQYGSVEDNDIACTNGKPTNENGDATPLAETPEVETKDEKAAPQPMVGMGEVFRFANCADRLLIVIGILASCTSGAAMPLMIIVFGGMTDSFIDNGKVEDFWKEYGANLTAQNITLEDIIAHPEILRKFLCGNSTDCPAFDNLMSGLMNDMIDQMSQYTIYYIILGSVVLVIAYIQSTCWTLAAYRQGQRIRTSLFHAILRQEIGWFDTHEIGELNTRLSDDVSKIQEGLGEKFGLFFQQFCSFLAGFTVGFVYGWQLTLVIVAVSPLLAISGAFMAKLGASFTSKELTAYAKAGAVAEEVLGAIRTVTAFGGQDKECKRYNENLYEARRFGIRKGTIAGSGMAVLFVVMFGSYALAFWYGSKLVREGDYTGGDVIIVFFSVLIGAFSVGNAAPNFQYFSTARGAAHKIYQIIDAEPSIDSSSDEGSKLQKLTGNMEFRNVHFRYPSRPDVKVLQGLNLSVSVGQTVALVGSSGCGKSTTIQLMQRFYDPLEGQVLLDGVDLRQLNVQWLRQNIGVVSQEPVLFGTTIAENIRYGRDNVSDEEIEKAARMANAHDFISTLPQKYETLVGERGAQLSGGQKQRVAIARALIRDPKILLLDEATSALDTESEATVQSALDKARQGRTTLVVAHRLSTIKTADVIVALKDGVVEEEGTHEELMQLSGIYYQLVTNQTNMDAMGEADEEDIDITEPEKGVKRAISLQRSFSDSGKFGRMTSVDSNQAAGVGKEGDDEEEEEVPEAALGRIMKLNAPEWYLIVLGCLAALVSGGVQPAFAVIFSEIIGVFSESDMEKQKSDSEFWSGMFAVIGISAATAMFLQSLLFSISGENLTMRLRRAMFESLMRQEIAYFDDRHNSTGALTTRLATEASAVQGATGAKLASSIQAVCSISLGLGIGFYYSWKLALFILAFAPFILISGFVQMKVMLGSVKKDKKALEEAGKVAVEAIENMRTVAQLTKEKLFEKHYVEKTEVPYKKNLRRVHVQGIAFGFSQGLIFYAYGFCFRFGAYLIENDGLEYVNMFKVISAIIFSAMSVGQASSFAPDYGKAKLSAAKIFALLDRTPAIDSSDIGGEMPTNVEGNVTFDDVKFRYPTRPDVRVLRGLDINVSRGQTLALVGSSGCGKSTCISLLERFYDPQEGAVKIDSQNISKLNIQWLRAQLGLVQQEPILFDRSIRDNIAYGDNRRDVPMSEIIEAAKNANIHDFISNLPKGYDTNVGDKGTQLSGGQKQRVAIARALVRNPTILLLDEATSALDTESEKVVQEALDRARSGRTCIVIAHRLSTIQDADVIAVVHKGRIVEQGTHSELMSQRGFYHKLNTTQTKRPTS